MRQWPYRLPGQQGAALLWTVTSDPNRVTLSGTAAALCGTPLRHWAGRPLRPVGHRVSLRRGTLSFSKGARGCPSQSLSEGAGVESGCRVLWGCPSGCLALVLSLPTRSSLQSSLCLGYVMVLERGTGVSIPTKPLGGPPRQHSRALQEAVVRPWICHDGVIDCLEGCPVGEPNTLAPSRLHREGIPAHVPTTMAIRAGAEMATPNGRRHK